jgi:hypothetical protein
LTVSATIAAGSPPIEVVAAGALLATQSEADEPYDRQHHGRDPEEVHIGEIPASEDPTSMLWTARCSEPDHDLLGHFATREEAEAAKQQHVQAEHRR